MPQSQCQEQRSYLHWAPNLVNFANQTNGRRFSVGDIVGNEKCSHGQDASKAMPSAKGTLDPARFVTTEMSQPAANSNQAANSNRDNATGTPQEPADTASPAPGSGEHVQSSSWLFFGAAFFLLVDVVMVAGLTFRCSRRFLSQGRPEKTEDVVATGKRRPLTKPVFKQVAAPSDDNPLDVPKKDSPMPDDDHLPCQFHENVDGHWQQQQLSQPLHASWSDEELKANMNAIVQSHVEYRKQCEKYAVQMQASMSLAAAEERQKRLSGASPEAEYMASPSPAKSLSKIELAYCAHLALSAAKDRSTPAKSPTGCAHWEAYDEEEQEVAPCKLDFCETDQPVEDQKCESSAVDPELVEAQETSTAEEQQLEEKSVKPEKQKETLDITQIPSPTRSRAKRQQLLAAAVAQQEEAWPSWEEVQKSLDRPEAVSSAATQKDASASKVPQKYQEFSSPPRYGTVQGRTQPWSSTPKKPAGSATQSSHIGSHTMPKSNGRWEEGVAARKAAAYQAWGVPTSESTPRPEWFM